MVYGQVSKERYVADKAPATPTTPGSMFGRFTRSFSRGTSKSSNDDGQVDPKTGKKLSKRALARAKGVYIPPSVEEAMEHRDEEHPRVQGPRGPEPYPLNIGTGDLGVEMGPGIALYFNFLQWMGVLFFVLFFLNFPTILVANAAKYYGPYSAIRNSTGYQAAWDDAMAGEFDFASTTFGSIAPDDITEDDWLIYHGFRESLGFTIHVKKVDFLYGCAAADLMGVFAFFVVMFFFHRRQTAIVKSVDEDSIEISDYSVTVKGLPEDATDKEEVRCFFELKFGKVVDAVLAKNDGVLLTFHKKRGELAMKYDELHAKHVKKGSKSLLKQMEKTSENISAIDEKIKKVKSKRNFKTKLAFVTFSDEESLLDCLQASPRSWLGRYLMPPEERFRGTHAYTVQEAPAPTDVMFENLDVSPRSRFYRRQIIVLVTCTLLVVSFAAITAISVVQVQLSLSTAMDPRALAVSIGGPGGGDFGTAESIALASDDPLQVTLLPQFNGTTSFRPTCETQLVFCESTDSDSGTLAVMPWGTPLTVLNVVDPMSASEKRIKVKTLMKEIEACGESPDGCSVQRLPEVLETQKCHACYCAGLQYKRWDENSDTHRKGDLAIESYSDLEINQIRDQCGDFLEAPTAFENLLLLLAVMAVSIVNSGLKIVIAVISEFERPDSFIELQKNVAEKVFVAQFFNTAVSSLVINAALPELVQGIPFLDGNVFNGIYRDFDQRWYQAIGGPLMITMLVNTVGPVGGNLFAEAFGSVSRFIGRKMAWTQKSLDEAYLGPEFDIATRYGEVLMCVMVTMMYGSGMPLLYAFASFFFLTIAYFDKRHLLRVCRRPPRYGTSLAFFALNVVPIAGFVHLLFGMWMHTHFLTPSIASATGQDYNFLGEDPYASAVARNATRDQFAVALATGASLTEILEIARNASEAAAAAERSGYTPIPDEINRRILQANGFPFFLTALVFVIGVTVYNVVSSFWSTFKVLLPCIANVSCLQQDLSFEGVPTFEDAFMMDKLVGAHTYEMRDMPKYKDFFFESRSPGGTPRKGKTAGGEESRAENDRRGYHSGSDSDSDTMGDIGTLLQSTGAGGGAVSASPLGGGFGGLGGDGLGLRAAYRGGTNWVVNPETTPVRSTPSATNRPVRGIGSNRASGVETWVSPELSVNVGERKRFGPPR